MKKFLIEILSLVLLFLAPLYALQEVVDIRARNNYRNGQYLALNIALDKKKDADVVIFGNSRAQGNFDTQIMDSVLSVKCCNMGMAGFPFDIQYNLIIKPYLGKNVKPKLIIYEIGPSACLEHVHKIYQYHFLPYINDKHYDYYIEKCDRISKVDRYLPFKYMGRTIRSFYEELTSEFGKDEGKDCFASLPPTLKYSPNIPSNLLKIERNHEIISQLQEFIQYCHENSIELLFVISPLHENDFCKLFPMDEFKAIADSATSPAEMWDYSVMFKSDTTYFHDQIHINAYGASEFTRKFAEDIKTKYTMLLTL